MEYMYAAMLLHKSGTDINEANMTKVLEAAGVKVDKAKVTVVVNALTDVDIEKVLAEATVAPVAAAAPAAEDKEETAKEEKEEEKKEEEKDDTTAAAGLGSLFG
jgi:large subunit ribosomal protein L12